MMHIWTGFAMHKVLKRLKGHWRVKSGGFRSQMILGTRQKAQTHREKDKRHFVPLWAQTSLGGSCSTVFSASLTTGRLYINLRNGSDEIEREKLIHSIGKNTERWFTHYWSNRRTLVAEKYPCFLGLWLTHHCPKMSSLKMQPTPQWRFPVHLYWAERISLIYRNNNKIISNYMDI